MIIIYIIISSLNMPRLLAEVVCFFIFILGLSSEICLLGLSYWFWRNGQIAEPARIRQRSTWLSGCEAECLSAGRRSLYIWVMLWLQASMLSDKMQKDRCAFSKTHSLIVHSLLHCTETLSNSSKIFIEHFSMFCLRCRLSWASACCSLSRS